MPYVLGIDISCFGGKAVLTPTLSVFTFVIPLYHVDNNATFERSIFLQQKTGTGIIYND
jgi:hypothetical protein